MFTRKTSIFLTSQLNTTTRCTSFFVVTGPNEDLHWMTVNHLCVQRRTTLEGVPSTLVPHLRLVSPQTTRRACLSPNAPKIKTRGRMLSWRSWDRLQTLSKNLPIPSTISEKKIERWLHSATSSCVQWWGRIISTTSSMNMRSLLLLIIS